MPEHQTPDPVTALEVLSQLSQALCDETYRDKPDSQDSCPDHPIVTPEDLASLLEFPDPQQQKELYQRLFRHTYRAAVNERKTRQDTPPAVPFMVLSWLFSLDVIDPEEIGVFRDHGTREDLSDAALPHLSDVAQTVELVHELWDWMKEPPEHPFLVLVQHCQKRCEPLECLHLHTPSAMLGSGKNCPDRPLVREPAVITLASLPPLEAIEVDGQPVSTRSPNPVCTYRTRRPRNQQGQLFPGPRTLNGEPVGDVMLSSLAAIPLTGDERNPIRADLYKLALFSYALSGKARVTRTQGVKLLTGSDRLTEANERRWWKAVEAARGITLKINPRTGEFRDLLTASIDQDGTAYLAPPVWWSGVGEGAAWRLSGGLFRPALLGGRPEQGTAPGYWGGLHRTVAGLEAFLTWSGTAGRGRYGRIPDALKPVQPGKHGQKVFASWREVLMLSGEYVDPTDTGDKYSTAGKRYRGRVTALQRAGYVVPERSDSAPAGDTIEIVERVRKTKDHEQGLMIRATARFCEAYRRGQKRDNWERIPAKRLFA